MTIRQRARQARAQHRGSRSRGQALVELAIVLPLLLAITGITVDFARVYQGSIALRGAARAAAEFVATDPTITSPAQAQSAARAMVCAETQGISGYQGPPTNCTAPTVTATVSVSTADPGSQRFPIGTGQVTATIPFQMLISWPLLTQNGAWTIEVTSNYQVMRNR